jgi:hypothetical protein
MRDSFEYVLNLARSLPREEQRAIARLEESGAEAPNPKPAIRATLTVRPSVLSIDEQKKILQDRGFVRRP